MMVYMGVYAGLQGSMWVFMQVYVGSTWVYMGDNREFEV